MHVGSVWTNSAVYVRRDVSKGEKQDGFWKGWKKFVGDGVDMEIGLPEEKIQAILTASVYYESIGWHSFMFKIILLIVVKVMQ